MTSYEVTGLKVDAGYMPTPQGISVPCVVLEARATEISGVESQMQLLLAPDLVEKLLPLLIQKLEQVQSIPSASSKGAD